jgi:hypothetical protein
MKDDNSISGRTITESVTILEGIHTTAITKFHAGNDPEEAYADSFSLSIRFTQSYLEIMNVENSHNAQEEMPNSDGQLDQKQGVVDFNPTTVEARQTKLITDAVKGLAMNPEEDAAV